MISRTAVTVIVMLLMGVLIMLAVYMVNHIKPVTP